MIEKLEIDKYIIFGIKSRPELTFWGFIQGRSQKNFQGGGGWDKKKYAFRSISAAGKKFAHF